MSKDMDSTHWAWPLADFLGTSEIHLGVVYTRDLNKGIDSSWLLVLVKVVLEQLLLVLIILGLPLLVLGPRIVGSKDLVTA